MKGQQLDEKCQLVTSYFHGSEANSTSIQVWKDEKQEVLNGKMTGIIQGCLNWFPGLPRTAGLQFSRTFHDLSAKSFRLFHR